MHLIPTEILEKQCYLWMKSRNEMNILAAGLKELSNRNHKIALGNFVKENLQHPEIHLFFELVDSETLLEAIREWPSTVFESKDTLGELLLLNRILSRLDRFTVTETIMDRIKEIFEKYPLECQKFCGSIIFPQLLEKSTRKECISEWIWSCFQTTPFKNEVPGYLCKLVPLFLKMNPDNIYLFDITVKDELYQIILVRHMLIIEWSRCS